MEILEGMDNRVRQVKNVFCKVIAQIWITNLQSTQMRFDSGVFTLSNLTQEEYDIAYWKSKTVEDVCLLFCAIFEDLHRASDNNSDRQTKSYGALGYLSVCAEEMQSFGALNMANTATSGGLQNKEQSFKQG